MRFALALLMLCSAASGVAADRVPIAPGSFAPVLAPSLTENITQIAAFRLDRRPVTNGEFLAFVEANPSWRRDRVASLFADGEYLTHWTGATELGAAVHPDQPVTRVSWFAARAYCAAQGGRLSTWYEWEFAAAADEHQADARQDPQWQARILNWYAQPASRALGRVGLGPPNLYGVQDLHGLIWEWVEDFSALMVSGDSRSQGDPDKLAFCGAGALSAKDRENYPVLMRIAFLSALEGRSTSRALGFRCAEGGTR